jgi:hypothetical protein
MKNQNSNQDQVSVVEQTMHDEVAILLLQEVLATDEAQEVELFRVVVSIVSILHLLVSHLKVSELVLLERLVLQQTLHLRDFAETKNHNPQKPLKLQINNFFL